MGIDEAHEADPRPVVDEVEGAPDQAESATSDAWRRILDGTDPGPRRTRAIYGRLPSSPRCKMCLSPFGGVAGPVMRLIGKGPWPKNPKYCGSCFSRLVKYRGGAEIGCSLLFADVRGSTTMAEGMSATAFRLLMERFFDVAAEVLVEHDAIVDKFVGDEVIGIFIPALSGERHAERAVAAARGLLAATGHGGARTPWLPIGVGVNTGVAFVGSVGSGTNVELTALGDPVNVAARLASAAGPGEILVSEAAAEAAGLDTTGLDRRELDLKGKSGPSRVVVVGAGVSPRR